MAKILKAKDVIDHELPELAMQCETLKKQGLTPNLKVILVGENAASVIYTRKKKQFCEKIGANCEIVKLPQDLSQIEFINKVEEYNLEPSVHGILIQLPLPKQLQNLPINNLVHHDKDVDGFHDVNMAKVFSGRLDDCLLPCTPKGIMTLLKYHQFTLAGINAVVVGRSQIVGRPMAALLTAHNATVTLCHSHTKNLADFTTRADLIVVAAGKAEFFGADAISDKKPIIIDVGMHRKADGTLCGDVNFSQVEPLASVITPVPGGIGPLTVFSVGQNLIKAANRSLNGN